MYVQVVTYVAVYATAINSAGKQEQAFITQSISVLIPALEKVVNFSSEQQHFLLDPICSGKSIVSFCVATYCRSTRSRSKQKSASVTYLKDTKVNHSLQTIAYLVGEVQAGTCKCRASLARGSSSPDLCRADSCSCPALVQSFPVASYW